MDASSFRDAVFEVHEHGHKRGHYFLRAEDERFRDRQMQIGGRTLLSFGSCSYLGLEFDERLAQGGADAYHRYGSQTSYSRGYLSSPLYHELEEDLFPRIFGAPHVLLLPSTSTAHHVVMPALLTEKDAAVCDHQMHRSIDDAVTLQCARSNAKKVVIKHGELEKALDVLAQLSRKHQHVWFMCDGIYSMYGDYLPGSFLTQVLAVAPNVRIYIDDAHGMSWAGTHGRGHFLSRFDQDERVVVVTSLAKAFATGGGVLVVKDRKIADLARLVGGPYSFSGPLRPGDLGATIASAKIHLSQEILEHQAVLARRIELANSLCESLEIPLVIRNEAPIFFIALGRVEAVFQMAERLREDGYHVNVSGFPAVPASRGGLRIAINAIHTAEQITSLFEAIARHLPSVLASVGVTTQEIAEQFADVLPPFARKGRTPSWSSSGVMRAAPRLEDFRVQTFTTIDEVDAQEWDAHLGGLSYVDSRTLRAVERVFSSNHEKPEHRWTPRYIVVRDNDGIAAMAPAFGSLMKDDTFMSAEVSAALERERVADPYLFTSRAIVTGTLASEGEHMYLRPGPRRADALIRLAEALVDEMKAQDATMLVLRDVHPDAEIAAVMPGQGFVPVPLIESYIVDLDWKGDAEFIRGLANSTRRKHVRLLEEQSQLFQVSVWNEQTAVDDATLAHMHGLYLKLARRNLRINIFPLPEALLRAQLASGSWEFVVLTMPGRPLPVAWGASRHVGAEYRWLYCGIDYDGFDIEQLSPYRQLLWQLVRRAGALGCQRLHLGMGTGREKQRFGARSIENLAFVRADNAFRATELQEFVTRLAIQHAS